MKQPTLSSCLIHRTLARLTLFRCNNKWQEAQIWCRSLLYNEKHVKAWTKAWTSGRIIPEEVCSFLIVKHVLLFQAAHRHQQAQYRGRNFTVCFETIQSVAWQILDNRTG